MRRFRDVALILGASIGLGFPALHYGMPDGHDSYEHVSRYSSVANQFREGEIYPRWLAGMNSGLGSPALSARGSAAVATAHGRVGAFGTRHGRL